MEKNDCDYLEKQVKEEANSALELIIREGACRMLQAAIGNEVSEYIDRFKNEKGLKEQAVSREKRFLASKRDCNRDWSLEVKTETDS